MMNGISSVRTDRRMYYLEPFSHRFCPKRGTDFFMGILAHPQFERGRNQQLSVTLFLRVFQSKIYRFRIDRHFRTFETPCLKSFKDCENICLGRLIIFLIVKFEVLLYCDNNTPSKE